VDNKEIKSKECWGYPTVRGLLLDGKLVVEVQLEISQNLGMDHDGDGFFPF